MHGWPLALPLVALLPLLAEAAKTSDLLIVSGARTTRKFRSGDKQKVGANRFYIAADTIQIVQRMPNPSSSPPNAKAGFRRHIRAYHAAPPAPLRVSVSLRGIPEGGLFLIGPGSAALNQVAACGAERRLWLKLEMAAESTIVGYIACFPADRFDKAQGELQVAVDDAEPEKIPIAFERQEGFFGSPVANALLSPALTGLTGLVGGAFIGFLGFLAQQRYLRRSEQMKAFRERKLQSIHKLMDFFKDTYPVYRNAANTDEATKLRHLQKCLISSDIYAILLSYHIAKLEHVFNSSWYLGRSRLPDFDKLIQDCFGELMHQEKNG
jgi:hypothetical protein